MLAVICGMATVPLALSGAGGQETPKAPGVVVIGQVAAATEASQNGSPLLAGGTIFENDLLTTGPGGQAVIKFSATSQIQLQPSTSVHVMKILQRRVVRLHTGNVVVENAGRDFTLVQTGKFSIVPHSGDPSRFYVGFMADNTTYIEAAEGTAEIEDIKGGRTYILPAGQNTLVPENAQGIPGLTPSQPAQPPASTVPGTSQPATTQPAKPKPASHSNTGLIIGIAAAAGIGGAVAALAGGHGGSSGGNVSPSAP